jgi:deoxyribodipyrimidine photo-lyase
MEPLQIVWFKRDLRAFDHRPLLQASRLGPVLPLLVVEPELWSQPDASARQWAFYAESIEELRQALALLGQPLVVRVGSVTAVLERARRQFGIAAVWSHQETGNGWTYERDRVVGRWARRHGITWTEIPPFGVIRGLTSREGWARRWEERMAEPLAPLPSALTPLPAIDPGPIPTPAELCLAPDPCPLRQRGGRSEGLALLQSFLAKRGARYHRALSSPTSAAVGCSRLSAHLAWGTLSLREVVQASRVRRQGLGPLTAAERAEWPRALRGFEERLHWHCHFIQKLECQPDLEFRSLHPLVAQKTTRAEGEAHGDEPFGGLTAPGLEPGPLAPGDGAGSGQAQTASERLAAWAEGRTGLPFVDACMRSLIASGWLNFRMRAMLMSVACHHLDLGWRDCGLVLAKLFLDYEPGIHWSQCQMQAGSTGINTIRIYNPIKQGQDHDPKGLFMRRWLPELAAVPLVHLHEPWTMATSLQVQIGCVLGVDYPQPSVDPAAAAREARERLWGRRRQPGFGAWADAIQQRHGSRRSGLVASTGPNRSRKARGALRDPATLQLGLDLQLDGSEPVNRLLAQDDDPVRRTVA